MRTCVCVRAYARYALNDRARARYANARSYYTRGYAPVLYLARVLLTRARVKPLRGGGAASLSASPPQGD